VQQVIRDIDPRDRPRQVIAVGGVTVDNFDLASVL
jgi:hypothetical protein